MHKVRQQRTTGSWLEIGSRTLKPLINRLFLVLLLTSLGLVCCLWYTAYSQTTQLCVQQELNYSRAKAFSVTAENRLNSQLLQDILRSYQHHHAVRRRELEVGKPSKTLTWYCFSRCGGIGDRVKGMYASFLLALVTNRTFFIHLSDEVQKTMFLEPSAIDWRPVHKCVELQHDRTLNNFGQPSFLEQKIFGMKRNVTVEIDRLNMVDAIYISNKAHLSGIAQAVLHSVLLSTDMNSLHHRLLQLVVESGEGESLHSLVTVLHHFLFSLPQQVKEMTHSALTELKLEPRGFVTVHVRTGFKNSLVGEIPYNIEFLKGTRFARSRESWRHMIDCAINVSDSMFGENRTVLVVSDDREPKNWAASEYKSRVTMMDIDPVHVVARMLSLGSFTTTSRADYFNTWLELSVMSKSSAIVSIKSGYSETASHIGHMDPHSVYIYDLSKKKCAHKWPLLNS